MCARFVTNLGKYDHISPTLESLHWLKIPYRVEYKILVLTFKCVRGSAPNYLRQAMELVHHRALRSTSSGKLPIPMNYTLSSAQSKSFLQVAPRLWNALPSCLRSNDVSTVESFKGLLKTHLYNRCFP